MAIFLFMIIFLVGIAFLGIPIALSMGITSFLSLGFIRGFASIPWDLMAQRFVYGVNNFTLLAIPFFLLTGRLANEVKVTDRIFDFANSLIGHRRGGLAHVNVVASMIFAGMSGSAVADAGGLGQMEIKAMVDDGYSEEFSVAVTGASATIGPILPPSIPVVLYGALAGASIAKLLIAGFVPGVLMGIGLMALIVILTRKYGYQPKQKASFSERWIALKRGFLPLLTPVILVGGIISGVFTPTEAAAVAVVYTFLLGLLYKNLTVESFLTVLKDTMRDSAIILFVVGASSIYSWVIARYQVTAVVVDWITMTIESPYVFLLVINIFLLIIGCFIDPTPAIFILVPVLVPLAQVYGIDISHFGIIMIFNLMIGLITPPVGTVLYALARIRDVPFQRIVYAMIPFYIPLLLTLLVITLVPAISLWLPGFIM
jgi:tripartite ATP-independent transporter DctM subunit